MSRSAETIIQANFHLCTADRQLRKSCRQCRAGRLQRRSCRQCKEGRHRRKGRLRCTSHRQCGEGRLRCTSRRRKRADHRQRTSHKRADRQQRKIHKRAGRRQRTSHGKRRSCIQNRATHLDQDPRWARSRHALSRNLRKASRRRRVGYFLFSKPACARPSQARDSFLRVRTSYCRRVRPREAPPS